MAFQYYGNTNQPLSGLQSVKTQPMEKGLKKIASDIGGIENARPEIEPGTGRKARPSNTDFWSILADVIKEGGQNG